MVWKSALRHLIFTTALLAGVIAPTVSLAERFRLDLTGGTLANFSMTCFAENNGRQTTIRRRGYLPQSYIIQAQALHCTIALLEDNDRLYVRLRGEGQRVIAEIQQHAFFGRVTIRSAGSWGPAGATKGAAPIGRSEP